MKIEFEKEYLRELYEDGKSSRKKHRFQPQIIKKYKNTIDVLKAARNIEDLFPIKSLHYEKLSGDKHGIESVKVNDQFRIEFKSRIESDIIDIITICMIIDLSKHYE